MVHELFLLELLHIDGSVDLRYANAEVLEQLGDLLVSVLDLLLEDKENELVDLQDCLVNL